MIDCLTPEFVSWYNGCQDLITKYSQTHFPNLTPNTLSVDPGMRYLKIVSTKHDFGVQRSVYCFIDRTNGDVLKAASWKAPAKHARGNIYATDNGLECMDSYGAKYLR